jgi:Cof subfamily protein (haloacid dehalogenase superfamily)
MGEKTKPRPSSVKALALDLDGTVLRPDNNLGERTIAAIRACVERGIRPILCTGRAVESVEKYRAALNAGGPHVYYNGAMVVEMPGGKLRALHLQDRESALFCAELARKTGLYYQVYLPGTPEEPRHRLIAWRGGPEWEFYRRHTGIEVELGDLEAILGDSAVPGCIKTMFVAEPEAQARVRPLIEERYAGDLYIAGTLGPFLELMNPRANKGEGLKTALAALNLEGRDLMAFGDEENDLPMFAVAGFSLAPANARETVRRAADLVIGSYADEAVAAFLEEFFKIPPG